MSFTRRLLQSLRNRGLRPTVALARWHFNVAITALLDHHFDIVFRTDTGGIVESASLGDVTSPSLAHGIRYQPTPAIPFRRLLRAGGMPAEGTFVDLGCGKGRALALAALAGFPRVVGVDYSPALCQVAERNLETIRSRATRRFEATVRAMDATEYTFAPDDTVIYLYNPFEAPVLRAVMANLGKSLALHPRPVWVIYHNPVWRSIIEENGRFPSVRNYRFGGCRFAVYTAGPDRAAGPAD